MKKVNGIWLPDEDRYFTEILKYDSVFQSDRLEKALDHVTDWSIAVDGGAHVGTWVRGMCDRFYKVIAVEPDASNHECLTRNVFVCTNVSIINKALGKESGKVVSIKWDDKHSRAGNTGSKYVSYDDSGSVKTMTIDELQLPSLGFLKLDVEGAEYDALLGAKETILKYKPVVFIESKPGYARRFGSTDGACLRLLKEFGASEVVRISNDYIFKFI